MLDACPRLRMHTAFGLVGTVEAKAVTRNSQVTWLKNNAQGSPEE